MPEPISYLETLNQEQKDAVLYTDGPLLILAGAGAGKTKTITHRILHLIHKGIAPHRILAITFTNKAGNEMKERVEKLIREDKTLNLPVEMNEHPFVSTFHSLGVHILREQAGRIGLPKHFSIFDRDDSKKAVKEAIAKAGLDPKQFEPGKILSAISKQKGNMVTAKSFARSANQSYFADIIGKVWMEYEKILEREKALDFDDLILKTALLLKENAEAREYYQNIWTHIHIDEYQDTNKVQYEIAKHLADKTKNICVVGDIDQNIYSWRGADIKNILNFEKDYPQAKTILLERNYRSTQTILTAANRIIEKNIHRKEKNLYTENNEGEKISLFDAYNENSEARFVANKAKELLANNVPGEEIAILYRTNFQSRALEEACISMQVPYQMLGVKFFERKEVKDVLSYIRASLNPDSISDIKRIINSPKRGIGKTTILKIFEGKKEELPSATKKKVDSFFLLLSKIQKVATTSKPSDTVKYVIKETGIETELSTGSEEDMERLGNVKELATIASNYDLLSPEEGIEKLLSESALATDQDSLDTEKTNKGIKMMTIHASKGLEFDYVFITGLEDGLFPSHKDNIPKDSEEGEEERRLFYVALTRARKKIFLSYAQMRTIYGSKQMNIPSEFVYDIDDDLVEREETDRETHYLDDKPLFRIDF